jgi:hypothetical protein
MERARGTDLYYLLCSFMRRVFRAINLEKNNIALRRQHKFRIIAFKHLQGNPVKDLTG